jgi:hypothetical protein
MSIPASYQSALFLAIIDWLNTNANEINWKIYSEIIAKGEKPIGGVKLNAKLENIRGNLLDGLRGEYFLEIAVLTPGNGHLEAITKAYDAEEYVRNLIVGEYPSLRASGISGLYGGYTLNKAFQQIALTKSVSGNDGNQDGFIIGHTQLQFTWIFGG